MMPYREMKTETLLLQPMEDGWTAVHKKYKTYYGSLAFSPFFKIHALARGTPEGVRRRALWG